MTDTCWQGICCHTWRYIFASRAFSISLAHVSLASFLLEAWKRIAGMDRRMVLCDMVYIKGGVHWLHDCWKTALVFLTFSFNAATGDVIRLEVFFKTVRFAFCSRDLCLSSSSRFDDVEKATFALYPWTVVSCKAGTASRFSRGRSGLSSRMTILLSSCHSCLSWSSWHLDNCIECPNSIND